MGNELGKNEEAKKNPKRPDEEDRKLFQRKEMGKKFPNTPQLGLILEEAGLINEEMIRNILQSSNESAASLKRSLISQGLVREDDILDALAKEMGMDKVNLEDVEVTPELLEQLDKRTALKYQVFPVKYTHDTIWVALSDPLNIQTTDDLERIVGKKVIGLVAPEDEISKRIKRYYEGDEYSQMYVDLTEDLTGDVSTFKQYETLDLDGASDIDQPPVVKFVDLMFKQAVHERASDIHIEPTRQGVLIRFRIDGRLHEVPSPPKRWQNAIISRLKVLSGMDLAEKRIPLDGRIKLNLADKKLDLRVSSIPAIFGETIVMRILDQSGVMMGLEDVGFMPDNVKIFRSLIRSPNGIILMTGPTGSGKTTTLYAALGTMNNPETKIITIENPVEYMIEGINQIQVNQEIGLDFARGLRSVLRQSPDVILVGEIRDQETAEIAIRAALTGHLVFSTLHTNDAASSTIRLIDMGMKPFLVASSLQAAIAQRLVRTICNYCKGPYTPPQEVLDESGLSAKDKTTVTFYKGKGCDRCNNTGYRGRTAIHEIFVLSSQTRQMVIRTEPSMKIKHVAVKQGMRTLRMDGLEKIKLAITTLEEVLRITQIDIDTGVLTEAV
jgi:type IV pilus assembly protein PilB